MISGLSTFTGMVVLRRLTRAHLCGAPGRLDSTDGLTQLILSSGSQILRWVRVQKSSLDLPFSNSVSSLHNLRTFSNDFPCVVRPTCALLEHSMIPVQA